MDRQDPITREVVIESAISTGAAESYKTGSEKKGGLWPNGKIYYTIEKFADNSGILKKLTKAIREWNKVNGPHCQFINIKEEKSEYYVTFLPTTENPHAHVGCWKNTDQFIKLPEKYPDGSKVRVVCILHEMMHCAGFIHEHSRPDRDLHCIVQGNDPNNNMQGFCLGPYDYRSIMHYGPVPGLEFKYEELKRLADRSSTFSAGDKAAIKLIYSPKGTHHGEWQESWTGLVKSFFGGNEGYWTCCMGKDKNSQCKTTHTGFWHEKCTNKSSGKCGGGCSYKGSKGHWSCCSEENLESDCKNRFKKNL